MPTQIIYRNLLSSTWYRKAYSQNKEHIAARGANSHEDGDYSHPIDEILKRPPMRGVSQVYHQGAKDERNENEKRIKR